MLLLYLIMPYKSTYELLLLFKLSVPYYSLLQGPFSFSYEWPPCLTTDKHRAGGGIEFDKMPPIKSQEDVERVLSGNLTDLPNKETNVIRMFLSSTFTGNYIYYIVYRLVIQWPGNCQRLLVLLTGRLHEYRPVRSELFLSHLAMLSSHRPLMKKLL